MNFREAIIEFEKENILNIVTYLDSKQRFELIEALYEAFADYKKEVVKIQQSYLQFFKGNYHKEIVVKHDRLAISCNHFINLFELAKSTTNLSLDESNIAEKYISEVHEFNADCILFNVKNIDDLSLYDAFFHRLKGNIGFHHDNYITFSEFKSNWKQIENMEQEAFINWVNAQRL